ncbi:DeoR/GlpR family DNA-binding transcription regulator [Radiobacillus deserti]|uniref:DeoR/GlpR transcriptional regulator n=1 Tax=Radiobacillus deserti TaxID=2594883 RepID=A0A516KLF6_9BACI|nr:DeoR/GlpR family DNA-binding transcription regulator [Radiobacillus deserti]QDP42222.1 DeoR/GlpR transcriptional regulator [Radiobacillus deserti]
MLAQKRQELILDRLFRDEAVKVANLVEEFGVSDETIRRDLELLESKQLLKRVHGGAVMTEKDEKRNTEEKSFHTRELLHKEEKQLLAQRALDFVKEGQSIALDVSTTNTELARALKTRFQRLTIVTNSLPIAFELSEMPQYTIILTGGIMRNEELCVVGEMTETFISQFHIDTLFLSASGISLHSGITDYGVREWNVKKKMLEASKECYIVADSSKFDAASLLHVCTLQDVKGIITDPNLSSEIKQKYTSAGISIYQ